MLTFRRQSEKYSQNEMEIKMKKYLDKFWLAPALAIIVLAVLYAAGFGICTHATDLTAKNGVVENATYFCYAVMFVFFIKVRKSFQTPFEKRALVMFWFFGIAAVLREAGIQHWLASCDTTAFKIRFFTNPDNPLSEKIVAFVLAVLVAGLFIYAMMLWLLPAFKGLFKLYAGSWTVITFLSCGALCKIADRTHGNLAKHGIILNPLGFWYGFLEIAEEGLEMMLPILAVVALMQFQSDKNLFYPRGK